MANETILSSIINPQVLADMIERKLVNEMKFTHRVVTFSGEIRRRHHVSNRTNLMWHTDTKSAYRDWETVIPIVTGKQIGRAHV